MGAWIWDRVAKRLNELGHSVFPVTLAGLESNHADISGIGLEVQINNVVWLLKEHDLRDVVVVGHSYGGIAAGIVADRVPERVTRTVFIEGLLPHNGRSALDAFPDAMRETELMLIAEHGGRWPIPDVTVVEDGQDLTTDQAKWLVDRFVGHPGRTLTDPVVLSRPVADQLATYIVCEREHFDGRLPADVVAMRAEPTWTFRSLDTGLWPMVSAPYELAALLDEAARG
jgi:pimeloyl-ACP methyl ester carboxylesterase